METFCKRVPFRISWKSSASTPFAMYTPQDFIEFPNILQRVPLWISLKSFRFDIICKGYPSGFQCLPPHILEGGGDLEIHRISCDATLFAKTLRLRISMDFLTFCKGYPLVFIELVKILHHLRGAFLQISVDSSRFAMDLPR